jgi:hypothetical protein
MHIEAVQHHSGTGAYLAKAACGLQGIICLDNDGRFIYLFVC